MRKKLLIIGHSRHGKDTVAERLRDKHGYRIKSSSLYCASIIFNSNSPAGNYKTIKKCFDARHNHREEWFKVLSDYTKTDGSRIAFAIMIAGYNVYVGMRSAKELTACRVSQIFDKVIWVDRSVILEQEPSSSMELNKYMADIVIDNNGSLDQLYENVDKVAENLKGPFYVNPR